MASKFDRDTNTLGNYCSYFLRRQETMKIILVCVVMKCAWSYFNIYLYTFKKHISEHINDIKNRLLGDNYS